MINRPAATDSSATGLTELTGLTGVTGGIAVGKGTEPAGRLEATSGTQSVKAVTPAAGYRVRPDAAKHVDLLLRDEKASRAATAGWEAYQRGDVAGARVSLQTAAEGPGVRPWVRYALGMAEYALRDFHGSVSEWETVRNGVPEFEPVYFDLVDGYLQLKDYDQAVRVLRAAHERWPGDVEIYNALGVVQTVRGVLDDAIKSFREAIVTAPKEATSYFNLGRAMEMRYYRSRRYVQQLRSWVANEQDRAGAIESYRRYLELGGPFANDAQEGLGRLSWANSR